MAAIGGAVAEEYYGWTGFYNEDELLKKYLDANLYNLVKLLQQLSTPDSTNQLKKIWGGGQEMQKFWEMKFYRIDQIFNPSKSHRRLKPPSNLSQNKS